MTEPARIRVATEQAYDIVIGRGILAELPALVGTGAHRVAVFHPPPLAALAKQTTERLHDAGYDASPIELPTGEAAKTIDVAAHCWTQLSDRGFTRTDAVVAIGGGASTDLAGFVAATFLRGIRLVNVPSTLLGMVDAAIGGKTGINTDAGKNLVGAFHQPAGVLCDLSLLDTLPAAEITSGLAEVVKCGFVADPAILDLVRADPAGAQDPASPTVRQLVERAVAVKAHIVSADPYEATSNSAVGREALNYGHTLGHAIERVEDYRVRHGEAVAVGMVYAAQLAGLAGRLDQPVVDSHVELLNRVGLPTHDVGGRWQPLLAAMRLDKKARADTLRFVILTDVGQPDILSGPDPDLLAAAYAATCPRITSPPTRSDPT